MDSVCKLRKTWEPQLRLFRGPCPCIVPKEVRTMAFITQPLVFTPSTIPSHLPPFTSLLPTRPPFKAQHRPQSPDPDTSTVSGSPSGTLSPQIRECTIIEFVSSLRALERCTKSSLIVFWALFSRERFPLKKSTGQLLALSFKNFYFRNS